MASSGFADPSSFPPEMLSYDYLGQRLPPPPHPPFPCSVTVIVLLKMLSYSSLWHCPRPETASYRWILQARRKTKEPIFSRLCSSLAGTKRERERTPPPALDISIRQIDSCCNGWSRKLQRYWFANVEHGHIDRVSENLRTWLWLALIRNDLPGASLQKAMSHSQRIS